MLDTIFGFFLPTPPPGMEALYYVGQLLIGIMVFDALFDIFRFVRNLIPFGRR